MRIIPHDCFLVYHLATVHSVTDRQTEGRMTLLCQYCVHWYDLVKVCIVIGPPRYINWTEVGRVTTLYGWLIIHNEELYSVYVVSLCQYVCGSGLGLMALWLPAHADTSLALNEFMHISLHLLMLSAEPHRLYKHKFISNTIRWLVVSADVFFIRTSR